MNDFKEIEKMINEYNDNITYRAKGKILKGEMIAIVLFAKEIIKDKDNQILNLEKQNIKTIIKYRGIK